MIYRLQMLSDENDFFRREIKIDSEATFAELNTFLIKHLEYSPSEMTTFHVCDEDWNKRQEITLMDMGLDPELEVYLMDETPLEELLTEEGQHLLFVFDLLSERGLFIKLAETIPGESLETPEVTVSVGKAPKQTSSTDEAELRSSVGIAGLGSYDEDDSMYEEVLDLDELDPDGFGELTEF